MTLAQRIGNTRWYCWRAHYARAFITVACGALLMFHAVLHRRSIKFSLVSGLAPRDPSRGFY